MRKIRQVLRLALATGASGRAISRSLKISRDAVTDYLTRARAAGLGWPLPDDMDDAALEALLFPPQSVVLARRPEPDWAQVHLEMKRKGATLQVLHEEFLEEHPDGIRYSHFCERYRKWAKTLRRYMRFSHTAGERVSVDYSGMTMPIVDLATGEVRQAQVFVGILGASNYTYAEAHWSQRLPDWIAAHVRMFEYFGGAPQVIVCDNLKAGVTRASRTDPIVQSTYQHLAEHYGALVLPARALKPKDKAKAENAVQVVQRWILFRLRNHVFTTLSCLNDAIRPLLEDLNNREFKKLPGSRRSQYESIDLPALQALPVQRFEYTEFHRVRVGLDSSFEFDSCRYGVPHALCRQEVDIRATASSVEILLRGRRVTSLQRGNAGEYIEDPDHLDAAQRYFGQWDADRELEWAKSIGLSTHAFLGVLLAGAKVKEQGYRAAGAMKKMSNEFGQERLEAGCARAINIGANSVASLRSILRTGLDQSASSQNEAEEASFEHPNVRGPNYYH